MFAQPIKARQLQPLDRECYRQLTAFAGTAPRAIDYVPLPGAVLDSQMCHPIIEAHVKAHGGQQVFGWMQGVSTEENMHEFIFHSVWERPSDCKLVDIVPNADGTRRTVFARDMKRRVADGQGYNNLFFACNRAALTKLQRYEWRAGVELKKLCWLTFLNAKPLSAVTGKFKQPARSVEELRAKYGLRIIVTEDHKITLDNLFDLSFNQLAEVEFNYAIDVPGLDQAILAEWPRLRNHRDVAIIKLFGPGKAPA